VRYYLISDGHSAFERARHIRVPLAFRIRRAHLRAATSGYLGTLALVKAYVLAVPLLLSGEGGAAGPGLLVVAILVLGPASDLAIALSIGGDQRAGTETAGPNPESPLDHS
jgi:hypothetical protein